MVLSSDFYTGGGIKVDPSGVLHKFEKLKLEGIPGTKISGTDNFFIHTTRKRTVLIY